LMHRTRAAYGTGKQRAKPIQAHGQGTASSKGSFKVFSHL
jgi:hypothetical protein